MKWQKSIRQENEPDVLEHVFVCRLQGQFCKARYLGYGVYHIDGKELPIDHNDENPVKEWTSITLPKRLK